MVYNVSIKNDLFEEGYRKIGNLNNGDKLN